MGWDGDRSVVVQGASGRGIVWASVWDSTMEAANFSDALIRATGRRTGMQERREAAGGATFHPEGRTVSVFPRIIGGRARLLFNDLPPGLSGVIDPAPLAVTPRPASPAPHPPPP